MRYIITIFLILFSQTANAGNICSQILSNKETEEHFAQNMSEELNITHNGKSYHFSTVWEGGTCKGDTIRVSIDNGPQEYHALRCNANGCSLDAGVSFVSLENKHFNIVHSTHEVKAAFNKLNGWQNLSEQEKRLLLYRNSSPQIYLMSPDSYSNMICSSNNKKEYQPKALFEEPICNQIGEGKETIAFPTGDKEQEISIHHDIFNPSQKITIDINNDGIKETLVPYQHISGARCGCLYETPILINENNTIIKETKSNFYQEFINATNLNCREWINLIKYNKSYYLEKYYGNKYTRVIAIEIIPLSGENAFKPICQYVNEAPLNLKPDEGS